MRKTLLCLVLLLTGCAPSPESYPIPPQHQGDLPKQEIFSFGDYVTLHTSRRGFLLPQGHHGTGGRELSLDACGEPGSGSSCREASVRNRRFHMQIGINDVTFRDAGQIWLRDFR